MAKYNINFYPQMKTIAVGQTMSFFIGGPNSSYDPDSIIPKLKNSIKIKWYVIYDTGDSYIAPRMKRSNSMVRGTDGDFEFEFDKLGGYTVLCKIHEKETGKSYIESFELKTVTAEAMAMAHPFAFQAGIDPAAYYNALSKKISSYQEIELLTARWHGYTGDLPPTMKAFSTLDDYVYYVPHGLDYLTLEKYKEYHQELRSLSIPMNGVFKFLHASEGKIRYPLEVRYFSVHNPPLELKEEDFITSDTCYMVSPKGTENTQYVALNIFAVLEDDGNWTLYDWTNPYATLERSEYKGDHPTIEDAFKTFDSKNRYPEGFIEIRYLTLGNGAYARVMNDFDNHPSYTPKIYKFDTDGKSDTDWWIETFNYIAIAFAIVAGIVMFLIPGGQIASAVLWGSILASAAAGSAASLLSIYDRYEHNEHDGMADTLDLLNILSCFIAVGSMARVATNSWRAGARLTLSANASRAATKYVLISQFAVDGISGILIAIETKELIVRILNDTSLSPAEQYREISKLVAIATTAGLMTAVNVKFTLNDLKALKAQNKHIPEETTLDEFKEILQDPDVDIDLTPPRQVVEGTTNNPQHLSRVQTEPDILAGAPGGSWKARDETPTTNIQKQENNVMCGQACGQAMLKDRGVDVDQLQLGDNLTSTSSLSRAMNTVDPSGAGAWTGNAVSHDSFGALNKTGSWSAMMWDKGSKTGHWVVVDGQNPAGNVVIRDPWNATSYNMTIDEFMDSWNGMAVYKQ